MHLAKRMAMSRIKQTMRTGIAISCFIIPTLAYGNTTKTHEASASPPQSSAYPDGTGDSLIDKLNNAQLDQNYQGPYYFPGQKIPPFKSVPRTQLEDTKIESNTNKNKNPKLKPDH